MNEQAGCGENPVAQLRRQGQSIWIDSISRGMIRSGELRRVIEEDGVTGVTSNPTIFEESIDQTSDYDGAIARLAERYPHASAPDIYETLALEDVRLAADVLAPVYERTSGADGFVSIEVSPRLAHNTDASIAEGKRLWQEVDRPNIMVKIPGTREGIPAIESLLAHGINVNVTLLFLQARYGAVARAFLRGTARCQTRRIASAASVFISRIDQAIDPLLDEIGTPEALSLRGKAGSANAKLIYQRFRRIFFSGRYSEWRSRGVRPQRVLWASTGAKNPRYSDVMYVEELIGPDSVNTMSLATLKAFREHGRVRGATIEDGLNEAEAQRAALRALGISRATIAEKLQREGIEKFSASLDKLLATLDRKMAAVRNQPIHA